MRRREFIGLIGSTAAWPLAARAQQPKKIPRLGYLAPGVLPNEYSESFFLSLRELGYIEGVNIQIDLRFAHGKLAAHPDTALFIGSLGSPGPTHWETDPSEGDAIPGRLLCSDARFRVPQQVTKARGPSFNCCSRRGYVIWKN
ncbi:hypothetical protein Q3C01_32535 [Bradyrhizobium sp. UFLA05-109]